MDAMDSVILFKNCPPVCSDARFVHVFVQMFLNEYEDVQWDAISYLVGECNYGGRVTDDRDRRCLQSILNDYINPAVIQDPKHKFSGSPNYPVPPQGTYEEYIQFIKVSSR